MSYRIGFTHTHEGILDFPNLDALHQAMRWLEEGKRIHEVGGDMSTYIEVTDWSAEINGTRYDPGAAP